MPGSFSAPGSSTLLHGCPRELLAALLAGAAETDDAVSALAIERETLALCRERQEVVNGIVALEGELRTLLEEARGVDAVQSDTPSGGNTPSGGRTPSGGNTPSGGHTAIPDAPTVKESAPVRVVSLPPAADVEREAPHERGTPSPPPAPPAWFWFSIIGMKGDLQAGVSDGGSVRFVREGDRLPGGSVVTGIRSRPPGVRIGGAGEASLPYRPGPAAASAAGVGR